MARFHFLWNILSIYILLYLLPTSTTGQTCQTNGHYNITQFGFSCEYRCDCVNNEQCDRTSGSCTSGCAYGYMGPGCQYRDIAILNSGTAMYNETSDEAKLAVDGSDVTCSRMYTGGEDDAWWRLDFERPYYIVGLVLETNTEMVMDFRVEGVTDVDSNTFTLCYKHSNADIAEVIEIMCIEPMLVQHVRITASSTSNKFELCEVGIYGGRYVSYKGSVHQSSHFFYWPMSVAGAAVDGRPMFDDDEDDDARFTCSVTNTPTNAENWRLEFANDMFLHGIYVYSRVLHDSPQYHSQIEGFSLHATSSDGQQSLLYTDDTIGSNWTYYQPRMVDLDIPILSRGVVIYSDPLTTDHLSLCEVEVFGECERGKCGWDCSDICHCSTDTSGAHRKFGKCPYGCMHRWRGQEDRCDDTCPDNSWGPNCTQVCFCSPGSQCDIHNGTCPGDCDVGWKGQACNETCDNNTYGINCKEYCGRCLDSAQCNITHGYCPGLCEPGLEGIFCNETCDDDFYGISCQFSCGLCLNSEVCVKTTGWCPSGCEPGYGRPLCDGVCSGKTYGAECHETCGNCRNGVVCHHINGHCPAECQPGWRGLFCKDVCADFYYGQDCNKSCGSCIDGSMCNKISGECEDGCVAGKARPLCQSDCAPYTYGQHCHGRCGVCKDNQPCDPTRGLCENGCEPGYDGDTCSELKLCSEKTYGPGCQETCGKCQNDVACDTLNGHCPAGCQPGWRGLLCKDVCTDFYYGQDCNKSCGSCIGGSMCNKMSGECQDGCVAGKARPLCQSDCTPYTYGSNCQGQCGRCKDNQPCDSLNGQCRYGCEPGYDRDTCEKIKDDEDEIELLPLIWGAAASFVCLVLVIVIVVICLRRSAPHSRPGFNDTADFMYPGTGSGPTAETEFHTAYDGPYHNVKD